MIDNYNVFFFKVLIIVLNLYVFNFFFEIYELLYFFIMKFKLKKKL